MRILITGSSGYIGNKLVEALLNQEWVSAVVGTDIAPSPIQHPNYHFFRRDIRENMDDIFEQEQIDTVIHTAYVLTPIHDKSRMEDININGSLNILQSSVKSGVKQILYTSSSTAYGFYADNDDPLREDHSPLRGNDDFTYFKTKKELEAIFSQFTKEHPEICVSVVRPCYLVGPGLTNPLAVHLKKKFVMLPANHLPWQFVHEDDFVNIMLLLVEKRIGGIYNIASDGTMTFPEMIKAMGNIQVPLPWWLMYRLNNLAWQLRLTSFTQFPSPALRMLTHPWICSNEKIKAATGYQFQYDTREAFMDFVRANKRGK